MVRGLGVLVAALVLASCGGGGSGGGDVGSAALTDVAGIFDVRAAFNADEGKPRLLLLLSPT